VECAVLTANLFGSETMRLSAQMKKFFLCFSVSKSNHAIGETTKK
jgi:hypothetical protein